MSDNVYQEKLMEHFKNSKYRKTIENPDFSSGQQNPSCGDSILIEGKFENKNSDQLKIKELGFSGSGCVVSQASASMLLQSCIGKTPEEILNIGKDDIVKLVGIPLGPNRIKCALLSLEALKAAFKKN
ncbi:iron-sulfur cluster assembly scaffold protein [Candidatus Dependentiae bacterium]|nr:iron-sulfur cluster assembly scaffold protein [Candidatus Dependentiae bacterium]MBU4387619.1 iron-sulfur cluster assembly scaffold protein [Candidatus Dependentiae bacterium]MCG2756468.1 iron-sulfur cluster assembly scaffold protein [Candidatus Dependentiae bacterium]